MEKKCKKAKWLSEEALQIAMNRREAKNKGEKERYNHLNTEFQRIARRHKRCGFDTGWGRSLMIIPYGYTVEVRNRFKVLDLIECLMNYGLKFMTLYRRQGSRPSPWKRNANKQKGCLGRPYK